MASLPHLPPQPAVKRQGQLFEVHTLRTSIPATPTMKDRSTEQPRGCAGPTLLSAASGKKKGQFSCSHAPEPAVPSVVGGKRQGWGRSSLFAHCGSFNKYNLHRLMSLNVWAIRSVTIWR